MKNEIVNSRLSIHLNNDGTLDEVIAYDESGECNFHMEQMDTCQWFMRWYSTKANPVLRELIVNIGPAGAIPSFDSPHINSPIEVNQNMNEDKRKSLEDAGWKFGDAADFLEMSGKECPLITEHMPSNYISSDKTTKASDDEAVNGIDHFIRCFGIEELLKEIIKHTDRVKCDENSNRLAKLAEDLTIAMKNYSASVTGSGSPFEIL